MEQFYRLSKKNESEPDMEYLNNIRKNKNKGKE